MEPPLASRDDAHCDTNLKLTFVSCFIVVALGLTVTFAWAISTRKHDVAQCEHHLHAHNVSAMDDDCTNMAHIKVPIILVGGVLLTLVSSAATCCFGSRVFKCINDSTIGCVSNVKKKFNNGYDTL